MDTFDSLEVISSYPVEQAIADGVVVPVTALAVAGAEAEPEAIRPLHELSGLDDYLRAYGAVLGKKAVHALEPLHVPGTDPLIDMGDLLREPFDAQKHVATAAVRMLQESGSGFIVGEMGTGKTLLAMTAVQKHAQLQRSKGGSNGNFRCLILCPDHLIAKWKREIEETIPDATVTTFGPLSEKEKRELNKANKKASLGHAMGDLLALLDRGKGGRWQTPNGAEYYIIGRNQCKWYPDWAGVTDPYKGFGSGGGRLTHDRIVHEVGKDDDGNPITSATLVPCGVNPTREQKLLSTRSMVIDKITMLDDRGRPIPDGKGGYKQKAVTGEVVYCPHCGNAVRDSKGVPMGAEAVSKIQRRCDGRYLQQVHTDRRNQKNGLDKIAPLPAKYREKSVGTTTMIGTNKYVTKVCGEPLWQYTPRPYRFSMARMIQKKLRKFFKYLIIDEAHEQKSDTAAQSMGASKLIGSVDHTLALTGTLIGGYAHNIYSLLMRMCPETLRNAGFEWGKDGKFSEQYGRIDRIVTTTEQVAAKVVSKSTRSMRKAKSGAAQEDKQVRPGIMPTLFGHHMIGNTVFIKLDEMAEGLPDLFEYIGGECPPPPEPTGDEEADEVALDQYERMKAFWVDTVCEMEPDQRAEYNRIESTLEFASKELLRRGSMKLLGTMLATTIGWPDFCHDKWAEDDDLADAINGMATNPEKQAPPLLGQSFLKHFNHEFDSDTETLLLTHPETRETDRISLVKNGGVYWLDVTFNGSKTRRFIYDTGASSISMPIMMASELGMAPKPGDPEHMVMVADGRHVKAKSVTARSVKVGKFTVNDVECSIDIPGNNTHTVGYWDKPNDKSIDNWMGVLTPNVLDAEKVYPKEQRLLDICLLHKKAGNQVWVYCQMTGKRNVMPRLKSILEKNGLRVGILKSGDVDPKEREEWIAKNGRQYDVMICFPQLVSTGLDLFSKVQGGHNYNCIVFYETGYKLNDMRQAARRSWRIGQPKDCYLYYLYYETSMQHRAMSLMSKKMAAALALEGEFSEEGLAAMAGDDNLQMALAKSMSEKIDSADMQRSWSKVTSSDKKRAKKKPTDKVATLAADAKPSPLDNFPEEFQLLGQTLLDRKGTPAPASAIPGIEALAARFAQADAGMWAAARNVAFGGERAKAETEAVGKFTVADGDGTVLSETENKIVTVPTWQGVIDPQPEPEPANPSMVIMTTLEAKPKLKVHRPEPDLVIDDLEIDEGQLAEMFANLASHGMTLDDLLS